MAGEVVLGYDGEPGSRRGAADRGRRSPPRSGARSSIAFGYAARADRRRRRRPVAGGARDRRAVHGRGGRRARTTSTRRSTVHGRARERSPGRGDARVPPTSTTRSAIVVGADGAGTDRGRAARVGHLPGRAPLDPARRRGADARVRPPGPRGLRTNAAAALTMVSEPCRPLDELSAEFGPTFAIALGPLRLVVVGDPEQGAS